MPPLAFRLTVYGNGSSCYAIGSYFLGSSWNEDGDIKENRKKSNTFRLAKQQLRTCITLFCIFLCCQCTTTGWKCIITRFGEDVNTRRRLSFSFPELWYSLLELICRKKCQHLTNWTTWNNRDKFWSRATSLFKWGLRNCRLRCCLRSIKSNPDGDGDGDSSETVT